MTRVDFYIVGDGERDRLGIACRLAQKAYDAGQRVHVHATDAAQAERFDTLLWTFRQGSFVPHGLAGTPEAEAAPVVIGHDGEPDEPYQLLFNLADDVPPFFSRFERVIEVIGREADEVTSGRARYRYYRERGYPLSDTRV
ncbi:MAG: DNA polymerase III subunit chi [Gammaproteobacteria bacterium]|nr:DNA polymerase III subunit chi [Gammaproteobacteria bacterium]